MAETRRDVFKLAALGGATVIAGPATAHAPSNAGAILHQVFFWLKRPGNAADREALASGLRSLAKIKQIRSLQVGVPASTEKREVVDSSFDISETMMFDSLADQKIYQDHPLHQEFIAKHSDLWSKVVVYDVKIV